MRARGDEEWVAWRTSSNLSWNGIDVSDVQQTRNVKQFLVAKGARKWTQDREPSEELTVMTFKGTKGTAAARSDVETLKQMKLQFTSLAL